MQNVFNSCLVDNAVCCKRSVDRSKNLFRTVQHTYFFFFFSSSSSSLYSLYFFGRICKYIIRKLIDNGRGRKLFRKNAYMYGEGNVLRMYVYIILCMLSVLLLYRNSRSGKAVNIHLSSRGNRTKNRIFLVGGSECHLSFLSLSLSLSLSIIVVIRLILLYQGKKIVQFLER